ncbi:MAG: DegT/DnrJ/EryC1/StrS family aminotransferase [Bacillota bacterium]
MDEIDTYNYILRQKRASLIGGEVKMKIEFFRHSISDDDIVRVNQVLKSIFLTTGEYVCQFEKQFASYLGCREVVGLTSCTAALHLSLLACGIGHGDEVITTPQTFIATANAVLHAGATPVFIDVEPDTGNIDASLIEYAITPKTKAIIPVHLYGQLCDMISIRKIADRYGLVIIEDAAHSIESVRDGIRPGQLGDAACFSFYATKNITSGEGGAVATNSPEIAEKIRLLRLHGMTKGASDRYTGRYQHWDMEVCGWKYNMDNIQAALLLGQLERIEEQLGKRERIARRYEEEFKNIEVLDFPKIKPDAKSARHLFTIWVEPKERDRVLWGLQDQGIGVAVNFRAIHLLKFYREKYHYKRGMFPEAERIGDSTISIPLYPDLKKEEIEFIINSVKKVILP